jgi:regulator of protease activity HflC (stomatin/prohibitin superfamily)
MFALVIFGAIIFIASLYFKKINELARYASIAKLVGVLLIAIGVFTSMFKQVDSGTVGVKTLFGKVQNDVLGSGLNFVNPMMDVVLFDVQTQNYTMSAVSNEGNLQGDDAIRVLSADGLEVIIDLTVLYRISSSDAPKILRTIGVNYTDKIVRPVSRTRIRDKAVDYDAISLYSTKRNEFKDRIFKDIDKDFKKRGLILEEILIRNINLPQSVKLTIESKINAEQDAKKMLFVLQKEQQEAERKRVEAQGIADYQRIISSGLTDKQLQYEQIKAQKELATSNNSKIIFMNGKTGANIMISDK